MQTKTNDRVYAGFFVRLAAYLIDWLIIGVALLIVKVPIWVITVSNPDNFLVRDLIFEYSVANIVIYLLTVTYFILLTYFTGATLGKKLFHLRVISAEERQPTFFEVLYRETVGKFLSSASIFVGYLMIGIDKKKRGLHDILADTCVVYYHERKVYAVPPVVYRNMNAAAPVPQNHPDNVRYMPMQGQNQDMGQDQDMGQNQTMWQNRAVEQGQEAGLNQVTRQNQESRPVSMSESGSTSQILPLDFTQRTAGEQPGSQQVLSKEESSSSGSSEDDIG